MWGCGREGLWGQMRSAVIDAFSALQARGGSRQNGYEENGYARKPPACVALPGRNGAAAPADTAVRKAGEGGTRHRFELLGLDFMVDLDSKIHFIEVNTNPSLSYQNSWHEGFVDEMAGRLLDVVLADVWPEGDGEGEAFPDSEPPVDTLKRPPPGWQYVMNVYKDPPKHSGASLSAMQIAADALRARGGGRLYAEEVRESKEKIVAALGGNLPGLGFGSSAPSARIGAGAAAGGAFGRGGAGGPGGGGTTMAASKMLAAAKAAIKRAGISTTLQPPPS
jgi:hypothetical protein